MKKLLSLMAMAFILDLADMECRVLKWDLMEESIGRSGTLVLMEKARMDKNGNILIVVLLPGPIRMEVILKFLRTETAIHMNLFLMNMAT